MIVLPALSGIAALIQLILEGAIIGAIFGGAIGGGGAAITEIQTHGKLNQQGVVNVAERAGKGAIEGAVGGAVTGGFIGVAGPALHPALALIDDFFRSIFSWLDDAARSVAGALDEAARSVASAADDAFTGIKNVVKPFVNGIRGQFNRWRNYGNAQNFKAMEAAPEGTKYVYVMEDSANGLHKIGFTKNAPPERLQNLSSATKSKLDYSCIIETEKNSKLESKLHSMFSDQRTTHPTPHSGHTEWFVLAAAQVATACSF